MSLKYNWRILLFEVFAIILAFIFIIPFILILLNSVKSFAEILLNPAALPKGITFQNYVKAWDTINYPVAFMNNFIITVLSNFGIVLISSMASYRILRYPNKFNKFVFSLFVASMIIPFQSIMIPLVKVVGAFNLSNSRIGLIVCYFGFGVSLPMFLYHGFIKSVPRSVEEAATIDGCSSYSVFFKIVLPLLKPMTATILILNTLWIWNDFLLPSLILQDKDLKTIPLAMNSFFAKYTKKWDLALAGLVMAVAPMIIFFLSLQKHIINGIVAGSVKG